MAKFHFKYGAMNSGKTSVLINTAYNYIENGLGAIIIKPSIDTKAGAKILSRNGLERAVDILITPTTNISDAVHEYGGNISCILVDEAQMLESEQIDQLYSLAKNDDISVICFGLRTDFQTNTFPGSKRALEVADYIEKIPTMCRCGNQAEFNCRKKGNVFVFNGDQIAIDGKSGISYQPLCGACYLAQKAKTQHQTNKNKHILIAEEKGK